MIQISELIKLSTDILASHGDVFVDIEVDNNRFKVKGIDIQKRSSTSNELIAVVYALANDKDNFK